MVMPRDVGRRRRRKGCPRAARRLVLVMAMLAACMRAHRPDRTPIELAIAARGGPILSLVRWVDAEVRFGAPEPWQARIVSMPPDRYALTIVTSGELHHHLFDGTSARSFVGNAVVGTDDARSPLATQARFDAVVTLDALARPDVPWRPLDRTELPADVVSGVEIVPFSDGVRYRLGFDDRSLVVWAAGPLDFSPFGSGEVEVHLEDFRAADGILFPYQWTYTARGEVLVAQQVSAVCVNVPNPDAAWFTAPTRLPACDEPSTRQRSSADPQIRSSVYRRGGRSRSTA